MKSLIVLCLSLLTLFSCSSSKTVDSNSFPKEYNFLNSSEFSKVVLSPDGKNVLVTSVKNGITKAIVLEVGTMRPKTSYQFEKHLNVYKILWPNNGRIILFANKAEGYLRSSEEYNFIILAFNIDGSKKKQIFPPTNSNLKRDRESTQGKYYSIASYQLLQNRYLILKERKWDNFKAVSRLVKIDVNNGMITPYDTAEIDLGSYFLDNLGRARIAYEVTKDLKAKVFIKDLKNNKWNSIRNINLNTRAISFLGFQNDNSTIFYTNDSPITGTKSLYRAQISETGRLSKETTMFSSRESDIIRIGWDKEVNSPTYIKYGVGKPKYKYFGFSKDSQYLAELSKAFPTEDINITSKGGDNYVVGVNSNKRPWTFYLFNKKKMSVNEFLSTNDRVRGLPTYDRKFFKFRISKSESTLKTSRQINAYLTIPKTKNKKFPIIVYVHGGPFGVYERWGQDGAAQLMASQGYGVLQVNYSGSGLRGSSFQKSGEEAVGTKMQEDIILSLKKVHELGYGEKGRACVWGISFGAFSAVMNVAQAPDYYRCGAASGGIYDLNTIFDEGDTAYSDYSKNYWKEVLPKSEEERTNQSPLFHVDKIKRPLFIMHGDEDIRCDISQAERLVSKLKEQKKEVRFDIFKDTGHWITNEGERKQAYLNLIKFFDKHLKN